MKKFILSIVTFLPSVAFAQVGTGNITHINGLTARLTEIGNVFIQILIAFAVIFIIFNVVRFITADAGGDKRKEYQSGVLWGIVGLFVILSIWGLVRILTTTFATDNRSIPSQQNGEVPKILYPGQ